MSRTSHISKWVRLDRRNSMIIVFIFISLLFLNNCSSNSSIYYYNEETGKYVNSDRTIKNIIENAKSRDEYCRYDDSSKKLVIGESKDRQLTGWGSPGRFVIQFADNPNVKGLLVKYITFTPAPIKSFFGKTTLKNFYLNHDSIKLIYSDNTTKLMQSVLRTNQQLTYKIWASSASKEPIIYDGK